MTTFSILPGMHISGRGMVTTLLVHLQDVLDVRDGPAFAQGADGEAMPSFAIAVPVDNNEYPD